MNLYRSFGNIMEAWVSEGGHYSDSESLENNDEDSPATPSEEGTTLRSESVDSGVETGNSNSPTTSCAGSTDNTEMCPPEDEEEVEEERLSHAPQSPVFSCPSPSSPSSSSPHRCPSRTQDNSTDLHQKLEQALQRTESYKGASETISADVVLRRRSRASGQPKRQDSARGQGSESLTLKRTDAQSKMCRRPMSLIYDRHSTQTRLEDLEEEERVLSPGLSYLEQVCQALEVIARQQMQSRASETETRALQRPRGMETLGTCPWEEEPEKRERGTLSASDPQRRKHYGHFRRRSASETNIASLHLRKLNTDSRGQHLSIDDLLEKAEEDHDMQAKKEELKKHNRSWKLKIGSLRRGESAVTEAKGQQTQSTEKSSARRRLSLLFRRNRRKTLPV